MSQAKTGPYGKKHPSDLRPDPKIADALKQKSGKGSVPCALAFQIADELQKPPAEVGLAMDLLELPIAKCQLGLFGYQPRKRIVKPAESVPEALRASIHARLVRDRLPCLAAWEIAKAFGLRKMEVSSACEFLKIKISKCQLGAF
jgi:hypothetical protein